MVNRASQRHQRTENSSQSQTTSANVALTGTQSSTTVSQSPDPPMIVINEVSYTLVPIPTGVPSVAPSLTPNADADVDLGYDFEICTGIAICSEPRASVN